MINMDIEYANCDWRKYKEIRLAQKRYCIVCNKLIRQSRKKMQKRTKYCSNDCYEDYLFDKRLRNAELRNNAKKTNKEKRRKYDSSNQIKHSSMSQT